MKPTPAVAVVTGLVLMTAGCAASSAPAPTAPDRSAASGAGASSGASSAGSPGAPAASGTPGTGSPSSRTSPVAGTSSTTAASASTPLGPGCADAARRRGGAGPVDGMAGQPVAVAASANPSLTTLSAALSGKLNPKVDLVDVLDGGEFTVFAPVDAAFAKLPPSTVSKLRTDPGLLVKLLTYHILPGRIGPDEIVGRQKTIEGSTLKVTGRPDALLVDDAKVICAGLRTANATVYLIDGVLTPSS